MITNVMNIDEIPGYLKNHLDAFSAKETVGKNDSHIIGLLLGLGDSPQASEKINTFLSAIRDLSARLCDKV